MGCCSLGILLYWELEYQKRTPNVWAFFSVLCDVTFYSRHPYFFPCCDTSCNKNWPEHYEGWIGGRRLYKSRGSICSSLFAFYCQILNTSTYNSSVKKKHKNSTLEDQKQNILNIQDLSLVSYKHRYRTQVWAIFLPCITAKVWPLFYAFLSFNFWFFAS